MTHKNKYKNIRQRTVTKIHTQATLDKLRTIAYRMDNAIILATWTSRILKKWYC